MKNRVSSMSESPESLYPQILLFGDSLTEWSCSQADGFGLMPALQNAYIRRADVVNRGFSGYNTDHALWALPKFFPQQSSTNVQLLIIFFGANDACLKGAPGDQHVDLEQYKINISKLVQHPVIKSQSPRILLITPPPFDEWLAASTLAANGFEDAGPSRLASVTQQYAQACVDIGDDLEVPVLDLWTVFATYAGWAPGEPIPGAGDTPQNPRLAKLLKDGLHFTAEGYRLTFNALFRKIIDTWPEMSPTKMPMRLPAWTEMPKAS